MIPLLPHDCMGQISTHPKLLAISSQQVASTTTNLESTPKKRQKSPNNRLISSDFLRLGYRLYRAHLRMLVFQA